MAHPLRCLAPKARINSIHCYDPTSSHTRRNEDRFLAYDCCGTALCVECFRQILKDNPTNLKDPRVCCKSPKISTHLYLCNSNQKIKRIILTSDLLSWMGLN